MKTNPNLQCKTCPRHLYSGNKSGYCDRCWRYVRHNSAPPAGQAPAPAAPELNPSERVELAREQLKVAAAFSKLKQEHAAAIRLLEQRDADIAALTQLRQAIDTFKIEPVERGGGSNEGTLVCLASDWHTEERVVPASVSGLNEFNLDIANARATRFFQSLLRLVRLLQDQLAIPNLVLALLGDFITGQIHGAENAESNQLPPTEAIVFVQNLLINGIQFLLDNSNLNIAVPCHMGNHGRTTITTRFTTENGHSLEYLMYTTLATHFRSEPRVSFQISRSMHSYMDIYGKTLRFQHGHAIKYAGGVGGLTIPANKAIAQWDIARRADIDCFGHFHTRFTAPKFICNGSLIGYNVFALSIKAGYEPPTQELFLMDKKRGKTCNWPIYV
jgi:hypothetical protein